MYPYLDKDQAQSKWKFIVRRQTVTHLLLVEGPQLLKKVKNAKAYGGLSN
jgi:hypothetical protein